jgi:TGF-beta propeptide
MADMKRLALILLALALTAAPARADSDLMILRTAPSADGSFPFWCDWGYDWDERCYRDFSNRLSIGGDVDKVWRSALRFPLSSIPRGSVVLSASLWLSVDGVCLGPRKTERACPPRSYTIDVHPIFSADWFHEREVDIGPLASQGALWPTAPQRLSWDVTDLVIEWVEYGAPNNGLLLKLAEGEEDFFVGGPRVPSAEFSDPAHRPALEVTYLLP